jgi:hypothetical protein
MKRNDFPVVRLCLGQKSGGVPVGQTSQSPLQHGPGPPFYSKRLPPPNPWLLEIYRKHPLAHVHFSKLWLRLKLEPGFLVSTVLTTTVLTTLR